MEFHWRVTQTPDWTILLIGGTSAAGKTTLAESLAARFQARYIDLDLFWIVLHRTVSPEVAPELHLLDGDSVWDEDPDKLVDKYWRVSAYVIRAVEPVIAHHHIIGRPVVLEGCWVLPAFAMQRTYAGVDTGDSVRALFLCEPELAAIETRIRARRRPGIERLPKTAQLNHLEMQRRYGLAIATQAEALGLPVLEARPFESLEARAIAAFM